MLGLAGGPEIGELFMLLFFYCCWVVVTGVDLVVLATVIGVVAIVDLLGWAGGPEIGELPSFLHIRALFVVVVANVDLLG